MKSQVKEKLLSIQHLIVAIILMTKGYDKVQHHHNIVGWTILIFGIIILGYFILSKLTKKGHSFLEPTIYLFESIALFFIAYIYFKEGKTFLPYITLVAGIGFLIAVTLNLANRKTQKQK